MTLQPDLSALWANVIDELTQGADNPHSEIPVLTRMDKSWLAQIEPEAVVNGIVVLSVPNKAAKDAIETRLADHLSAALRHYLPELVSLALSVKSTDQPSAPAYDPPVAPTQRTRSAYQAEPPFLPPNPGTGFTRVDVAPESAGPAQRFAQNDMFNGVSGEISPHAVPALPTNVTPQTADWQESARELTRNGYEVFTPPSREQRARGQSRTAPSLNPKYTLETFVAGNSNRFAHAAIVGVSESPGDVYNPLFIWGGSGLGKTHLLHGAGHYMMAMMPNLRVKYVSSEEFTNDFINSVRDDRQESFKRRYRDLDVLLVDDIQFLQGKDQTQEEFFHTFNALYNDNKQIILTSDRPPDELGALDDRLRTRFAPGLFCDIQPPELETRIAILSKKAQAEGMAIPQDVLALIAEHVTTNIRELEGALVRVNAYSSINGLRVDTALAQTVLGDVLTKDQNVPITAATVLTVTASYFNLTVEELCGTGRSQAVAYARQVGMYLCRELTDISLIKIGRTFGGRDHSTVYHGVKKIAKEIAERRTTYNHVEELTRRLRTEASAG